MWGQVVSEDGFRIMAFDIPSSRPWSPGEAAFFVSLTSESETEIASRWSLLGDGGSVLHPLEPAQWAPLYGMLKDRFGITWVLSVDASRSA